MVTVGQRQFTDAAQSRRGPEKTQGLKDLLGFLHKEGQMKLENWRSWRIWMTLWIWSSWMTRSPGAREGTGGPGTPESAVGPLSLERKQDSQPVNQHSEHEPNLHQM